MIDEEDQLEESINEDAEGESFDEDGEEEGGDNKLLIIIGAAILLLVGGGAGAYFSGLLDPILGGGDKTEEMAEKEGAEKAESKEYGGGNFLEIPTMVVNLNTESGTPRYLRLTVQLELKKPEDVAAVEAVIPRVVDQFQTYLRELRVRDLRGSAGIYRLQMELLWRVNQAAAPVEVKDVLFQEILIQ